MALQIRRGTNAERQTITPLQGELLYTTDTKNLYVGDGTTQGGVAVGGGGGGGASNSFASIAVAGQGTVTADSADDTLTLVAGSNVTITTNATTDSITISSTAGATNLDALTDVTLSTPAPGQVLQFNGTAWVNGTVSGGGGGGISNVVEDTSPQLGGDLDLNSNDITGAGDINITGIVTSQELKVANPTTPVIRLYESAGNQGTISAKDVDSDIRFLGRRFLVGDGTNDSSLRITSVSKANAETLSLRTFFNTGAGSNELGLSRSRGTGETPVAVQDADIIYRIRFNGHDGTSFVPTAQIFSEVSGTVGVNQVPGTLKFSTADSLGVLRNALTIRSDQVVEVNFGLTLNDDDLILKNANPIFQSAQADSTAKVLEFTKSRGTLAAPAAINPSDFIYTLRFNGYDGAANQIAAQIRAEAGSTVSTGIVSGQLRFITAGADGVGRTAILIDDNHVPNAYYGITLGGNGNLRLNNTGWSVEAYSAAQTTKVIEFKRARGTTDVPLPVQVRDHLYSLRFNGYDGTQYNQAAVIRGEVHETASAGITSGLLRFMTADSLGAMTTALEIDDTQQIRVLGAGGLLVANTASAFTFNGDSQASNGIAFNRSRGTLLAPTASQVNDYVYSLRFNGHDGTNYVQCAQIRGEVSAAVSTGVVPGRLRFTVNDATGAQQNIMIIGGSTIVAYREIRQEASTGTNTVRSHTISASNRLSEAVNYLAYTQLVSNVAETFSAYSYSATTFRGAKLTFTVTRGAGDVRVQEVLIANDGSTATSSSGTALTRGTDPISVLAVIVNGGNVVLRLTTDTNNTAGDITKVTVRADLFNA